MEFTADLNIARYFTQQLQAQHSLNSRIHNNL